MSIFDAHHVDPELIVTLDSIAGTPYVISIAKVGGGTIGEAYAGFWLIEVEAEGGEVLISADDLYTRMPKTHEEAARITLDFLEDDDLHLL